MASFVENFADETMLRNVTGPQNTELVTVTSIFDQ